MLYQDGQSTNPDGVLQLLARVRYQFILDAPTVYEVHGKRGVPRLQRSRRAWQHHHPRSVKADRTRVQIEVQQDFGGCCDNLENNLDAALWEASKEVDGFAVPDAHSSGDRGCADIRAPYGIDVYHFGVGLRGV